MFPTHSNIMNNNSMCS